MKKILVLAFIVSLILQNAVFGQQKDTFELKEGACIHNGDPIIKYRPGWDVPSNSKSQFNTRRGREKINHKTGVTNIYATVLDGYMTPRIITAKQGDTINLHLTSLMREAIPQSFSIKQFNKNTMISPGETKSLTFKADTPGIFPYFSKKHCSVFDTVQVGHMIVEGVGQSIDDFKKNIKQYTKEDYEKQHKINIKYDEQNNIRLLINKVSGRNYRSYPPVVEMLERMSDFIAYGDSFKKDYMTYAKANDWDKAYFFAKKYRQYKRMAEEKGVLALAYLDDPKEVFPLSPSGHVTNKGKGTTSGQNSIVDFVIGAAILYSVINNESSKSNTPSQASQAGSADYIDCYNKISERITECSVGYSCDSVGCQTYADCDASFSKCDYQFGGSDFGLNYCDTKTYDTAENKETLINRICLKN